MNLANTDIKYVLNSSAESYKSSKYLPLLLISGLSCDFAFVSLLMKAIK